MVVFFFVFVLSMSDEDSGYWFLLIDHLFFRAICSDFLSVFSFVLVMCNSELHVDVM